jgi:4-hydroxy-tetrahydrodipicolinate synthase
LTTTSRPKVTKAERKDWARAHFRGAESVILPSFTPDYQALDEDAIRHDVRQSIKHGFFSVFATGVSLRNEEERRRFVEIIVDEAGDRLLVSLGAGGGSSVEESVASLQRAADLGCSHVMYSLPPAARFETEDELVAYASEVIDSTDLGIVLYIRKTQRVPGSRPGHVPIEVLSQLAEHPNVVGAKLTQVLDPVSTFECCSELGSKLLLGPVNLEMLPFIATICPVQFTAMWQVETCQSPDKPYVVDYLNLLAENRIEDARRLYWQFEPLVRLFWQEQAPILARGGHPWVHLKYHQWCVGGNGGLFRPPETPSEQFAPVTADQRLKIKDTYSAVGIVAREPDEEFLVGRAAFGRGTTTTDLSPNPLADWG